LSRDGLLLIEVFLEPDKHLADLLGAAEVCVGKLIDVKSAIPEQHR